MNTTPISPKVTAGASTSAIVGLLLQVSNYITPDTFSFLGKGQGLAFLLATLASGGFAAWAKADPLRTLGLAAASPSDAPPTTNPAPAAAAPTVEPSTPPTAVIASDPVLSVPDTTSDPIIISTLDDPAPAATA